MSSKDTFYPAFFDHLPDKFIEVAKKELNETPQKRVVFIQELKIMAKGEENLNGIDFQPDFLLQFLRVSKFNIDKAFKRLNSFVNFRRKHPTFFIGVEENKLSSCLSYRFMSPLPWRCPDGCGIVLYNLSVLDTNKITYEEMMRVSYAIYNQGMRDPATQINGAKLIMDFENTHFRQLKYCSPRNTYQVVQLYLECCPVRFKQIHCVNSTIAMKAGWAILVQFLPEKFKQRVIFHNHAEDLLEYFPKQILPVKYGGDLEDYYMGAWIKKCNSQMKLCTLSGQSNNY